jgi:ABC-type polysaccharide/polyol phosphate transport system ATPase subunit
MSHRQLVSVEGLGKKFKIYGSPWARAAEWLAAGRTQRHTDFWALRDVTFTVERGECFGVIGPNGSGKTTLLKLLSGVLFPSEGRFRIDAPSVFSLLELGTGFHPDLTGRENVAESARLLGLPDAFITPAVMGDIRAFADIGDYFDRPYRFYSSGMQVRLGFAMMAGLKPDLLIVDEALSVGDVFFQQKCAARIDAMREAGTSFLFVSHDMDAVRRLCRASMLLDHGRVAFLGPSSEAINRYHATVGHLGPRGAAAGESPIAAPEASLTPDVVAGGNILRTGSPRHGAGGLEIVAARVSDDAGRDTLTVGLKEPLHLDLTLFARQPVVSPSAGLYLFDRFGNLVFSAGTRQKRYRLPDLRPGESLVVRLTLWLNVQPGLYTFALGTSEPGPQPNLGHLHDQHEMLGPIEVLDTSKDVRPFYGIAELPLECRHGPVGRFGAEEREGAGLSPLGSGSTSR